MEPQLFLVNGSYCQQLVILNIKRFKGEYTFQDILDGREETQGVLTHKDSEEFDLFDFLDEDYNTKEEKKMLRKPYAPCANYSSL